MLWRCSCVLLYALHAGALKPERILCGLRAVATWTNAVPKLVPRLENLLGANARFANACALALCREAGPTFKAPIDDTLAFAQVIIMLLLDKLCRAVRSL